MFEQGMRAGETDPLRAAGDNSDLAGEIGYVVESELIGSRSERVRPWNTGVLRDRVFDSLHSASRLNTESRAKRESSSSRRRYECKSAKSARGAESVGLWDGFHRII